MKIKGTSTITKIIFVLVLTVGVLAAVSIFSYNSYKEFSSAIDSLGADVAEDELSYKISTELNDLQSKSRAYSLSLHRDDLDEYISQTQLLKKHIEELYVESIGRSFRPDVDQLRQYFRMKQENYRNLITLKLSQSSAESVRDAMNLLDKGEKLANIDGGPKKEVTTTTITQPVGAGNNVEKDGAEKPSFFKRIFGGSSSTEDGSKKDEDKTVPRTTKETVVEYDSSYVKKVDTLISSVKSALAAAERERLSKQRELEEKELELLRNDQEILQSLRRIINKINESQQELDSSKRIAALEQSRNSFLSVIGFAAMGGGLSILLIILVIRDIFSSERLKVQLATARNRAENLAQVKEEFLANMSHEIRTPLNSIIGFTNQLVEKITDKDHLNQLRHVQSSSEHLLILVNDILDFSKIESGKLRIDSIGFKVQDVVADSLKTIQHQAEIKGIQLRQEIDPSMAETIIKGDPLRLKQILINLAGNGVKFTNHGYVQISVYLDDNSNEKFRLRFEVEDTGKGIQADKLESIFDSFSQEDGSITRQYGGTGLGLSISRKLVDLQNGRIFASSEPGQGATFSFLIDYEKGEENEYVQSLNPEKILLDMNGKSLLLIDDDGMNHVLLKPLFERWGLEFEGFTQGAKGLARAREKRFDFILTDLQMPDISGWEVVEGIRTFGESKASKIVLCTANALVEQQTPEKMELLDSLLLKPFKEIEVSSIIASLADADQVEDESEEVAAETEEVKLFNLENFRVFANNDDQLLKSFIDSFIEANQENLSEMRQYLDQKDYQNLGDVAHKMKNTYGQLEAQKVMIHLAELETLVDEEQAHKVVQEHVNEVVKLSDDLFKALKNEIEASV